MSSFVYSSFQLEGLHRWADCPIEEVDYLRNLHRHQFHFKVYVRVTHDDRDVEFIEFAHIVKEDIVARHYDGKYKCCNFDKMSCEHLCSEILENFPVVVAVEVSEDGENGSVMFREDLAPLTPFEQLYRAFLEKF